MRLLYNKLFHISITVCLIILFNFLLFSSILISNPNSICLFGAYNVKIDEDIWNFIKTGYFIATLISWSFISYSYFTKKQKSNNNIVKAHNENHIENELSLKIGTTIDGSKEVLIPEKGLYQNILITGTIGTGKTSSAMYPFLEQLLMHNLGMLILDVKGNFHKKVLELNQLYHRKIIVIELNRKVQI